MEKIVRKIYLVNDFEKEEQWLNEMSAQGWQLVEVGFCKYKFKKDTNQKYLYKLEFLEDITTNKKSQEYIQFLEDMGIEHIASFIRWGYFRKIDDGEAFEIYSDLGSRIKHLNRISKLMGILGAFNLVNAINTIKRGISSGSGFMIGLAGVVLLISFILLYAFVSLHNKKKKLEKLKIIQE